MGVAIPDVLQEYRVRAHQAIGGNGWRTAHNCPTEALLDATDKLGMLVWDENHRNGQPDEMEILIRRDRNHPSVVIWSLCNEKLCSTKDATADALIGKSVIKKWDPVMARPMSANYNNWSGKNNSPLDLAGFDYSTQNYDNWHKSAGPGYPSISSETSSAVSDRGELKNDKAGGHVSGYDSTTENKVPWGQTAEGAWGGVGISNQQGILTRDFMSGGFTWTGFDYKGEPTPYSWPDINSHFGILDEAGFMKDRAYWYQAWWGMPKTPVLHVFPHWNAPAALGTNVSVWAFSNADEVELFLNGKSLGRESSGNYAHAEWQVPYAPGTLSAKAYMQSASGAVANATVVTTGAPTSLKASFHAGVGEKGITLDGADIALVKVEVVDAKGMAVPTANQNVTFAVSGDAVIFGTGNGDPADHTPDKSTTRPAFHGLVMGVVQSQVATGGNISDGTVTVKVTASGLTSDTLTINTKAPSADMLRLRL